MHPIDIKTINDLILYCQEVLDARPEYMRESEQIPYAAAIVGLYASPEYEKLEAKYPEIVEITDLASNLEIPNTENTTIDWRRIKELVNELEQQAKFA